MAVSLLSSCSGSSGGSGPPAPQVTALVKDIHTKSAVRDSLPRQLVRIGATVYFVATTGPHGTEIWKTDGSDAGTVVVKDIVPGSVSSFPDGLTVVGNTLYFSAFGPTAGRELYKTDGTTAGTVLVKDIKPGCDGSSPRDLTAGGNTLYFAAADDDNGRELWKSDGTAAGTVMVKDIDPRVTSGSPQSSFPSNMAFVNSTLFFNASTKTTGAELWKTDGSAAGTLMVADIRPGVAASDPINLRAFKSKVFFAADDGSSGFELWSSDGTTTGTSRVQDIQPGLFGSRPAGLTLLGSTLLFAATGSQGNELWKTDGTSKGTVLVRDILTGSGGSSPGGLTVVGNTLYFAAAGKQGRELWKSDATTTGTVLVKDINTTVAGAGSSPVWLTAISGTECVFAADNGTSGVELWKSDGTATGTQLLADFYPGTDPENGNKPFSSSPADLVWSGHAVLFSARDGQVGRELFKSFGTAGETLLVKNLQPESGSSSLPTQMIAFRGAVYFVANDGNGVGGHGFELWRTDGTTAGTLLFRDIRPGPKSSLPAGFTVVGNTMFFAAFTDASGRELWKTDGTIAGTSLVRDIQPGVDRRGNPRSSAPASLTAIGTTLLFTATDEAGGNELWRSAGTPASTARVKDIRPGSIGSGPSDLTRVGNTLFFAAADASNGRELWKSNATDAGTVMVKDVMPGSSGSSPANLAVVGNTLFFVANDGNTGRELWKSDVAGRNPVLVRDINSQRTGAAASDSFPMTLTAVANTLFFAADDGLNGRELWASDGSEAGTVMLRDIYPGKNRNTPNASVPSNLLAVDGGLIFWANDGISGAELWRSDGTNAGTVKLKEIFPGCLDSTPPAIRVLAGVAWFYAATPQTGFELWRSDGTANGTALVFEFNPGLANGIQGETAFALLGGNLFTSADDGVRGMEPWRVNPGR